MSKAEKRMKQSSAFKSWYEAHKDEFNARRRARYKRDEKYREAQLANVLAWQKERAKARKKAAKLAPPSWTIGQVAKKIGCGAGAIRAYEERGDIPLVSDGHPRRKYTANQIRLIRALFKYRSNTHYRSPGYEKNLAALVKQIKIYWKKG